MYFSRYVRWSHADADGLVQSNCAPQCYGCNIGSQGKQWLFSKYIDHKHGEGTAQRIADRSQLSRKYTDEELKILSQLYKTKVDEYINKHS